MTRPADLTDKQIKDDFMARYGHIIVKFRKYYKYHFHYTAILGNGSLLYAVIDGNRRGFFGIDVEAGLPYSIEALDPDHVTVYNGQDIVEEYANPFRN